MAQMSNEIVHIPLKTKYPTIGCMLYHRYVKPKLQNNPEAREKYNEYQKEYQKQKYQSDEAYKARKREYYQQNKERIKQRAAEKNAMIQAELEQARRILQAVESVTAAQRG